MRARSTTSNLIFTLDAGVLAALALSTPAFGQEAAARGRALDGQSGPTHSAPSSAQEIDQQQRPTAAAAKGGMRVKLAGQAVAVADLAGDEPVEAFSIPVEEPVRLGVSRLSVMLTGEPASFAQARAHVLARPMHTGHSVDLADLHLTLTAHPMAQFKMGRFKKPLSFTYTPFWSTWSFYAAPPDLAFAKANLGLAGRGDGAAVFGKRRDLFYFIGAFNGLEEAKASVSANHTATRSDESVQALARFEAAPTAALRLGVSGTILPKSTNTVVSTDPADPTQTTTVADSQTLGAYGLGVQLQLAGVKGELEWIGHSTWAEAGPDRHGGGAHLDLLYEFAVPLGSLQPGMRLARQYADLEASSTYRQSATAALNWRPAEPIRIGLEVSHLGVEPSGASSTQALLQLAAVAD